MKLVKKQYQLSSNTYQMLQFVPWISTLLLWCVSLAVASYEIHLTRDYKLI